MKLRLTLLLIYIWMFVPIARAEPQSLSLDDSYKLAKQASEVLKRQDEDIKFAEAKYTEALSALFPDFTGSASQRFRNTATNNSNGNSNGDSSGNFQGQGKHPFETTLSVSQTIFSGFRDRYLVQATKADIRAISFDRVRGAELLYSDVATFFNQVTYYSSDLGLLKKAEDVLKERITDLKRFIQLGKSRESEIQAAQAELADVEATQARVVGLLAAAKEMLAYLVARDANSLVLKDEPMPPQPNPLDVLVAQAKARSDVQAALERVTSAEKQRKAAEREHWPNVTLEGNYYPYQDPDSTHDWDVFLKMSVPIYDGGGIDGRIAQSKAKESSSLLASQENARSAERDVRIAFSNVEASRNEVSRLKALLEASKKSYEAQKRDYELGVVTNLDVLAAIRNTLDAARRLIDAEATLRINFAKLKVAAGEIA